MCARYQHCCRHRDRLDNQQRRPRHPTYSIDTVTHSCGQITKLQQARSRSLGVREISVGAGTGADVMAGGAGAAGPATDLRHQPPGISHSKQRISQNMINFFGISRDIPNKTEKKRLILGYPPKKKKNFGISQDIPKLCKKN